VEIKNHFVMEDPYEKNLRKTLNFGHTIGHAFESLAFSKKQSLLHGEAVANGMICELYLSKLYYQNDEDMITKVVEYIRQNFRQVSFSEADYGAVYNFLLQDKKNQEEKINFTLLRRIGEPVIDHYLERNTIEEALDYYRHHNTLNT
jgi:3-dehydroquinate synthase